MFQHQQKSVADEKRDAITLEMFRLKFLTSVFPNQQRQNYNTLRHKFAVSVQNSQAFQDLLCARHPTAWKLHWRV